MPFASVGSSGYWHRAAQAQGLTSVCLMMRRHLAHTLTVSLALWGPRRRERQNSTASLKGLECLLLCKQLQVWQFFITIKFYVIHCCMHYNVPSCAVHLIVAHTLTVSIQLWGPRRRERQNKTTYIDIAWVPFTVQTTPGVTPLYHYLCNILFYALTIAVYPCVLGSCVLYVLCIQLFKFSSIVGVSWWACPTAWRRYPCVSLTAMASYPHVVVHLLFSAPGCVPLSLTLIVNLYQIKAHMRTLNTCQHLAVSTPSIMG